MSGVECVVCICVSKYFGIVDVYIDYMFWIKVLVPLQIYVSSK